MKFAEKFHRECPLWTRITISVILLLVAVSSFIVPSLWMESYLTQSTVDWRPLSWIAFLISIGVADVFSKNKEEHHYATTIPLLNFILLEVIVLDVLQLYGTISTYISDANVIRLSFILGLSWSGYILAKWGLLKRIKYNFKPVST